MTDFVPAAWAQIYWNHDTDGRIRDVRIVHRQIVLDRQHDDDLGQYCAGASFMAWKDFPQLEAQFGEFAFHGFASDHEMRVALVEFARVDTCQWARRMAGERLIDGMVGVSESDAKASRKEVDRDRLRPAVVEHFLHGKR